MLAQSDQQQSSYNCKIFLTNEKISKAARSQTIDSFTHLLGLADCH